VNDLLQPGEAPPTPTPAPPAAAPEPDPFGPRYSFWTPGDDHTPDLDRSLQQRPGRVIVTMVPKGGTGKTSFTAALAVRASQRLTPLGQRVALLDANLQQGDILRLMGVPPGAPTIYQIAQRPIIDQQAVQEITVRSPRYPLDLVVPSNLGTHGVQEVDPDVVTPRVFTQVASCLAHTHNWVFVDTQVAEPHAPMVRQFSLLAADFILVVLDHDQQAVDRAIPLLQLIPAPQWRPPGSRIDLGHIGVVLNRYNPQSQLRVQDLRAQLSSWLWMGTIPYYQQFKDGVDRRELWLGDDLGQRLDGVLWHLTGHEAFRQAAQASGEEDQGKPRRGGRRSPRPSKTPTGSGKRWYSFLLPKD